MYALYHIDPVTKRTMYSEYFHAHDDVEAIALVRRRDQDQVREIWHDGRQVARMEAIPDAPSE